MVRVYDPDGFKIPRKYPPRLTDNGKCKKLRATGTRKHVIDSPLHAINQ